MKCKYCGNKKIKAVKFKNGCLCEVCYNALPNVIKYNVDKVSADEVCKIKDIITKHKSTAFVKYGNFGVCEESLQINEWEIKYKNISKIYLSFHPRAVGNYKNTAYGKMCVVIETRKPCIIIEDILADTNLEYKINGMSISYYFPISYYDMVKRLQSIIDDKSYNMKALKEEMKRKREEKEKREERKRREEKERREKDNKRFKSETNIQLQAAEKLYGIKSPYTIQTIRSIRTKLIKINHPDQGGDTKQCALINSAFDLLKRYAVN